MCYFKENKVSNIVSLVVVVVVVVVVVIVLLISIIIITEPAVDAAAPRREDSGVPAEAWDPVTLKT